MVAACVLLACPRSAPDPDELADAEVEARLAEAPTTPFDRPLPPPPAPLVGDAAIEAALRTIEDSSLRFIVPEDDAVEPMSAHDFSKMLRRKSRWLAADIHELEPWIEAIASRTWRKNEPYRAILEDGREVDVGPWLRERMREVGP